MRFKSKGKSIYSIKRISKCLLNKWSPSCSSLIVLSAMGVFFTLLSIVGFLESISEPEIQYPGNLVAGSPCWLAGRCKGSETVSQTRLGRICNAIPHSYIRWITLKGDSWFTTHFPMDLSPGNLQNAYN